MRYGARAFLAGSLGFAVAFVVACGGGNGLLSGNQANTLNNELASISNAVSNGNCSSAQAAANRFSTELANLPKGVNTTLINNLDQGIVTVGALAQKACSSTTSSTTTTTTTTTSTPTTTTNPTTTTTSTPTTTTTSTPTTTATKTSSSGTTSNGGAGLTTGGGGAAGVGAGNGAAQIGQ